MISRAIEKTLDHAYRRKWERTCWAIDIHETMILLNWSEKEIPKEFYPMAMETMQAISRREDIVTILYTCSHPREIEEYQVYFRSKSIRFDYVNENPEVKNKK